MSGNTYISQAIILDFSVTIFLMTAFLGIWTTFDSGTGILLFILTLVGFAIAYIINLLSPKNLELALNLIGGYANALVLYFLLSNDWTLLPADFEAIDMIGKQWMRIRPELSLPAMHPNMVAGILAAFFPLLTATVLRSRKRNLTVGSLISWLSIAFVAVGLVMTSSRAAWLALMIGLLVWLIFEVMQFSIPRNKLLIRIVLAILISTLVLVFLAGIAILNSQDGIVAGSFNSRQELARNSWDLAEDFIWTGGGLGAFAGLYSSYILLIPVPFFFYSHNLYLDILIEQGIFGILAWTVILIVSLGLLFQAIYESETHQRNSSWLVLPVLAGLLIVTVHSLVDNPFYAPWGRPLIGLLPGLALAVSKHTVKNIRVPSIIIRLGAIMLTLIPVLRLFYKPLAASWQANIGSVQMAKLQLNNWPMGIGQTAKQEVQLTSVQTRMQRVLELDPGNFSAHYRLGLIALQTQDFSSAIEHLQIAHNQAPDHRGITKALGYSYLWSLDIVPG